MAAEYRPGKRDGRSGEAGRAVTFSYCRLQGVGPRPRGFPSHLPTGSELALTQPLQDPQTPPLILLNPVCHKRPLAGATATATEYGVGGGKAPGS